MRHIRVLICQVDDGTPDLMSELACFDLATPDVATLQPETALDVLEATTQETGTAILRRLLHAQWDQIDAALVARHCARVAPAVVQKDGHETVTVASRFGLLHLARQVCIDPHTQSHSMPGNAVLPPHGGMIITRGLQEWCCLLPQELGFEPVARLLGWQAQEEKVLCATTIRSLVRTHGQILRQAEQAEAAALLRHDDLETLRPQLIRKRQVSVHDPLAAHPIPTRPAKSLLVCDSDPTCKPKKSVRYVVIPHRVGSNNRCVLKPDASPGQRRDTG